MNSRFTQQCNVVFYIYADLLAGTSQFSILSGQNMQLTGCHNGNEMRNATCVDIQISIEWPCCHSLCCAIKYDYIVYDIARKDVFVSNTR